MQLAVTQRTVCMSGICHTFAAHVISSDIINKLGPGQDGPHFADDIFKLKFFNKDCLIFIQISLKIVPKCPINNETALVRIMVSRRTGNKPLSEAIMI